MKAVIWYLRQLFPLTYRSYFESEGKKTFCVWRMWFGKVFAMEEYEVTRLICTENGVIG